MDNSSMKCVMVIDAALPIGVAANTSAILGIALGKHSPEMVGKNVTDASKRSHLGIGEIPVSMLRTDRQTLKALRARLYSTDFSDLAVADFSDVAQSCNIYSEYITKAGTVHEHDYTYLGIAIYGNKKKVNKLTGSMPLLR